LTVLTGGLGNQLGVDLTADEVIARTRARAPDARPRPGDRARRPGKFHERIHVHRGRWLTAERDRRVPVRAARTGDCSSRASTGRGFAFGRRSAGELRHRSTSESNRRRLCAVRRKRGQGVRAVGRHRVAEAGHTRRVDVSSCSLGSRFAEGRAQRSLASVRSAVLRRVVGWRRNAQTQAASDEPSLWGLRGCLCPGEQSGP
jgi:hypothetical protein